MKGLPYLNDNDYDGLWRSMKYLLWIWYPCFLVSKTTSFFYMRVQQSNCIIKVVKIFGSIFSAPHWRVPMVGGVGKKGIDYQIFQEMRYHQFSKGLEKDQASKNWICHTPAWGRVSLKKLTVTSKTIMIPRQMMVCSGGG